MRRLICTFVVRIWQNRFSHDMAHLWGIRHTRTIPAKAPGFNSILLLSSFWFYFWSIFIWSHNYICIYFQFHLKNQSIGKILLKISLALCIYTSYTHPRIHILMIKSLHIQVQEITDTKECLSFYVSRRRGCKRRKRWYWVDRVTG